MVLLVLAGAGIWVAATQFGGDGGGGGGKGRGGIGTLKLAWSMDLKKPAEGEPNNAYAMLGSWMLDQTLVRAQHDKVTAFTLADGKEAWSIPVPQGTTVCTTSPDPADGVVAVVYGPKDRCDQMATIDLNSGQRKWTVKIPFRVMEPDIPLSDMVLDPRPVPQVITVGDSVLVYAENKDYDREIVVYSITDGTRRWGTEDRCSFLGLNADEKTVVVGQTCLDQYAVLGLDMATGAEKWRTSLTKEQEVDRVLSVSPTILAADEATGPGNLVVLDDAGKVMHTIPRIVDNVEFAKAGPDTFSFPYLVSDDTLYVQLDRKIDVSDGQIVAFDLKSGQVKWKSTGHTWKPTMIRIADEGLLALEASPNDGSVRLVRVDLGSGKVSDVAQGPDGVINAFDKYQMYERNGTVAIMTAPWTPLEMEKAIWVLRPES
ncbi:PQQ-binding-like beta-propeller repeat protein [Micromonospora sp. HM5-17]|uniref:outer membrane protein assembly factor BamB family protein n=1 Tax=Micromonospora sp. HM5-17 TaxID=2487710 RepID=UPI000F494B11|nr:PQQ-binding-like beta-propeller repeat protein [Micromonospora sp. HM5-17]ROT32792.1 hypothetical protein EF879_06250 [Micromonospora sp. HM5-17]